jgi:uncharacterized protein YdiU (UPF0061 family)
MTLHIPFDNSYAALPPHFYTRQVAQPVRAPRLLAFNQALAEDLGITPRWRRSMPGTSSAASRPSWVTGAHCSWARLWTVQAIAGTSS